MLEATMLSSTNEHEHRKVVGASLHGTIDRFPASMTMHVLQVTQPKVL